MKKTNFSLSMMAAVAVIAAFATSGVSAQEKSTEQTTKAETKSVPVAVVSAPSSVSIYGLLEASISRVNGGTSFLSNTSTGGTGIFAQRNMTSINGLGSRIGFMGSEDLGNGLRAKFQLEQRFTLDNGANAVANSAFSGRAVVGFDSPYGEFLVGRNYVPAYYVATFADPFAFDNSIGSLGSGHTFAGYSANAVGSTFRMDNSATYTSPVFLDGVTVSLAATTNEAVAGPSAAGYGVNAIYDKNSIKLGFGGDKRKNGSSLNIVAASYDLGYIKPVVSYSRALSSDLTKNIATSDYSIGATAPVAGGVVKAVYARLKTNSFNVSYSKIGLGYEYSMSKRTSVFSDLASGSTTNQSRINGIDVGIRHIF